MSATESLTIEILGDSSGLSQSLDEALSRVESLQTATDSASSSAEGIGGRLASVSTALQPLQLVGQQLTRISQQVQALGQQPITLNVQPALSALQTLMSAIQAVAAQLSSLSFPGPGRGPGGTQGPSPGTSRGGSQPRGTYAAPSLSATRHLGSGLSASSTAAGSFTWTPHRPSSPPAEPLDRHHSSRVFQVVTEAAQQPIRELVPSPQNSTPSTSSLHSRSASRSSAALQTSLPATNQTTQLDPSLSTTNHFGGITIQVRETADVNALMRDLRLQGLSTRHRQG